MTSKTTVWCCVWALGLLVGCQHISRCLSRAPHEDESRAGRPAEIAPWAHPSDTGNYVGYTVGGGAAKDGDAPGRDDGTWGWDYQGCRFPSNVVLGWWHGDRCQGGAGAYQTDGPRPCEELKRRREE